MKKVILLFFVALVMTLAIAVIAIKVFPVFAELNELQQVRVEIQQEEAQKIDFYQKVEELCLEYVSGKNETLNEKFNLFLEKNSISKERILDYTGRLKTYNEDRNEEFRKAEKELENSLNNQQISEKTFKQEKENLLKEYENSLNTIEDYLNTKQKEAFENSKDLIEDLYKLIEQSSNNKNPPANPEVFYL